jgi:hypothetical protein
MEREKNAEVEREVKRRNFEINDDWVSFAGSICYVVMLSLFAIIRIAYIFIRHLPIHRSPYHTLLAVGVLIFSGTLGFAIRERLLKVTFILFTMSMIIELFLLTISLQLRITTLLQDCHALLDGAALITLCFFVIKQIKETVRVV